MNLEQQELIGVVYDDLFHIRDQSIPDCTDHQLRRISGQMRQLLIGDMLIKCWKLLDLTPKQPFIVAPKLLTDDFDSNAVAVAGGGQIGGASIANFKFMPGKAMSENEIKEMYEREK